MSAWPFEKSTMNEDRVSSSTQTVTPLRLRLLHYENECRKKKEISRQAVIPEVNPLNLSLTDVPRFHRSPAKTRSTVSAGMVNKIDSSIIFEFDNLGKQSHIPESLSRVVKPLEDHKRTNIFPGGSYGSGLDVSDRDGEISLDELNRSERQQHPSRPQVNKLDASIILEFDKLGQPVEKKAPEPAVRCQRPNHANLRTGLVRGNSIGDEDEHKQDGTETNEQSSSEVGRMLTETAMELVPPESAAPRRRGNELPDFQRPGLFRGNSFGSQEEGAQDGDNAENSMNSQPIGSLSKAKVIAGSLEKMCQPPSVSPVSSRQRGGGIRRGKFRGNSFDDDDVAPVGSTKGAPFKENEAFLAPVGEQSIDESSHSVQVHRSMRPGCFRGLSFSDDPAEQGAPQNARTEEERKAKEGLSKLLDRNGDGDGDGDVEHREPEQPVAEDDSAMSTQQTTLEMPFPAIRQRYIVAIDKLRPEDFSTCSPSRATQKKRLNEVTGKKSQFIKLQSAWDNYEEKAHDKPDFPTPADDQIDQDIKHVEEEVVEEYVNYSKKHGWSDDDDDNDDTDDEDYKAKKKQWMEEAKRLKADALARTKAKDEAKIKEDEARRQWLEQQDLLKQQQKQDRSAPDRIKPVRKGRKPSSTKNWYDEDSSDVSDETSERPRPRPTPNAPKNTNNENEQHDGEVEKGKSSARVRRPRKKYESDGSDDEAQGKAVATMDQSRRNVKGLNMDDYDDPIDALEDVQVPPFQRPNGTSRQQTDDDDDDDDDDKSVARVVDAGLHDRVNKFLNMIGKEEDETEGDDADHEELLPKATQIARSTPLLRDAPTSSFIPTALRGMSKNVQAPSRIAKAKKPMSKKLVADGDDDEDESESVADDVNELDLKPISPGKLSRRALAMEKNHQKHEDSSDESENAEASASNAVCRDGVGLQSPKKMGKRNKYSAKNSKDQETDDTPVEESGYEPEASERDVEDPLVPKRIARRSQKAKQRHRHHDEPSEGEDSSASPSTPKGKDKKKVEQPQASDSPKARNADGTVWRNPLKGWHNMPQKRSKLAGAQIRMFVPTKTDCWRKTRHNFIVDNAPFHWLKVTGNFEAMVRVSGSFDAPYDKAGLKVRLDESNWILAGMENVNGVMNSSISVTLDHTDWTLAPLPTNAARVGIWFCFKRLGTTYETFFSTNGQNWVQTRQGLFTNQPTLYVGICGASPMGQELRVNFEYFRCRSL